ncbi:YdcF family protein [Mucilaginibacter segetis]|uniref:YdcF family protein n=1 Tax=Mucilaginibacter segetis TaxID=2793071 RepID=A0A934PRV8_9SPHI|nr:YdcF family protein [Mucilaginibacter segetis]MBK0377900.1 YdcF family protein [Mucilaginibacter segetis]
MIVILGNTNDDKGLLSLIAKSRCDTAIALWNIDKTREIVTTGTFGGHFNSTLTKHSEHLKKYLNDNGIPVKNTRISVNSSNTFQDIAGLRDIIRQHRPALIDIITSDFHYGRVKFYCDLILFDKEEIFPYLKEFNIISTTAPVSAAEKKALVDHEKSRMAEIMDFPTEAYTNASAEQKHYDTVSIAMITGQFTAFALGFKFIRETFSQSAVHQWHSVPFFQKIFNLNLFYDKTIFDKLFYIVPLILLLTLFWELYKRAAATARSARRTLRNIERCYSQFGFSLYYSSGHLKDRFFTFKRMLECVYVLMCIMLISEAGLVLSAISFIMYMLFMFKKVDKHKL